jgi:hypothetical protein
LRPTSAGLAIYERLSMKSKTFLLYSKQLINILSSVVSLIHQVYPNHD